jgi:hypothetical protein
VSVVLLCCGFSAAVLWLPADALASCWSSAFQGRSESGAHFTHYSQSEAAWVAAAAAPPPSTSLRY